MTISATGKQQQCSLLCLRGDVGLNGVKKTVTLIDTTHYWSHTDDHWPHLFSIIIEKNNINDPLLRPNCILVLFLHWNNRNIHAHGRWLLMCNLQNSSMMRAQK